MAPEADPKRAEQDAERARRRDRRRKRTLLNLGMPFKQVDQFFNQSEDAIALGYRVLEQTVKEIQEGYKEVKEFNERQRTWMRDGGRAPVIPWDQLVSRAQNLQNFALDAMIEATDIFADSARSATATVADVAATWRKNREEGTGQPLAGPIFADPIAVDVAQGDTPRPVTMDIRHVGLARLRINAAMNPHPQLLGSGGLAPSLAIRRVTFEPNPDDREATSTLTIEFAPIPREAPTGLYEGVVKATNFQLMIARLRVRVTAAAGGEGASAGNAPRAARRK
jgi:hypothetical protein